MQIYSMDLVSVGIRCLCCFVKYVLQEWAKGSEDQLHFHGQLCFVVEVEL